MPKPEFEFAGRPIPHTDCFPHIEGLSEQILARDSDSDAVTRILTAPGADTSPTGARARLLGGGVHL
jgi:hypothetical protein